MSNCGSTHGLRTPIRAFFQYISQIVWPKRRHQREGHTPTPSGDELTQDDLRRGLSRSKKARESNQASEGTKTEVEVRQFLTEARNLGTSRPQGGIAAAIEAAAAKDGQVQAPKWNGMEDYWKRVQTGCFEPTRDEEDDCDGIESCRDTSEGQESAPAPSPLYQSSEDEVEVEVTYENDGFIQQSDGQENAPTPNSLYSSGEDEDEVEVTYENASSLVAAIKKEEGQNTVPQTPSSTLAPVDSPPEQTIHERVGPRNQLQVKERLGKKQYDSPPRHSIQERRVLSS